MRLAASGRSPPPRKTMSIPFIQYLVDDGAITPTDAERIEAWTSRRHDPIGIIAVEHGMILGRQIDQILSRQQELGLRFGQTGVEMGHLTEGNMACLLELQQLRASWRVIEAILLSGMLPSERILRAYATFVLDAEGRGFGGLAAAA